MRSVLDFIVRLSLTHDLSDTKFVHWLSYWSSHWSFAFLSSWCITSCWIPYTPAQNIKVFIFLWELKMLFKLWLRWWSNLINFSLWILKNFSNSWFSGQLLVKIKQLFVWMIIWGAQYVHNRLAKRFLLELTVYFISHLLKTCYFIKVSDNLVLNILSQYLVTSSDFRQFFYKQFSVII